LAPDGKSLVSIDWQGHKAATLWNSATGKRLTDLEGAPGNINHLCYSPDCSLIATSHNDSTVKLWDTATGKERGALGPNAEAVLCTAFAPDGKTLAAACKNNVVRIWNVATSQPVATLQGHQGAVNWVLYSPDGKALISTSDDQTLRLWSLPQGEERAALPRFTRNAIGFAPDGRTLATGHTDGAIKIWEVNTGALQRTLQSPDKEPAHLEFLGDGHSVLLSGGEGRIVRWRLSDGSVLDDWSLHPGSYAHAMSDGRHIVVTTPSGPAYIVRLSRWLGVRN
jgi:WD40 repeat protein